MDKQQKLKELAAKINDCEKEITELEREIVSPDWKKVRKSLRSSAHYLRQADKQITDLAQMEGQMSLFDADLKDWN